MDGRDLEECLAESFFEWILSLEEQASVMRSVMTHTDPRNHRVSPSLKNLLNLPCRHKTNREKFKLAMTIKAEVTYSMKGESQ